MSNNVIDIGTVDVVKEIPQPSAEMEAQMIPLHDNVFCRLDEKVKMKGGIIIPDMAQNKRQEATVVAVGPGRVTEAGTLVPCSASIGDRVLLPKWGGSEEDVHGVKYSVVKDTDILCLIATVEEEGE